MGPDNRTITMQTVIYIEKRAAARIPLAKIASEVHLPDWQVEQILVDGKVPYTKAKVYADITLRRAAATREMTDLGLRPYDIAVLLQCEVGLIYGYFRKFNIPWTRQLSSKDAWLTRLILRDFGKPGMTSKIMAERYGTSQNCISASICRLRNAGKLPPSMHSRAKPANIDQHQPASHA